MKTKILIGKYEDKERKGKHKNKKGENSRAHREGRKIQKNNSGSD
jgi:hypothetical protein